MKSQLIGKDPDPGKDWGQEEETTEDGVVRKRHRLSGCEFEQAAGDSGGQRSLVCCSPWGRRSRQDLAAEQPQNARIWQMFTAKGINIWEFCTT